MVVSLSYVCVQAMAWCPWRQGVLATGGGAKDGRIRLWYAQSGEFLEETFTKSQVYFKEKLSYAA